MDDWEHLCGWFLHRPGHPSRIETLTRDAIAAVRTLTLNLTRLSRSGIGAASRRADLLRLARFFDTAEADALPRIAAAAFGMGPANHYGVVAEDAEDPVSTTTSWWDAPRARVPVSIRERGETTNRGNASPLPDRTKERELMRRRREQERAALERVDHELLDLPALDGSSLSGGALVRLQVLVSRTLGRLGTREKAVEYTDRSLACRVERSPGRHTRVRSPAGVLTLQDLTVSIAPNLETDAASREIADAV